MLQSLAGWLTPAAAERLTLLANHVIGAEPAAMQRLQPHAGRTLRVRVEAWPALLPAPPPLAWRVTPAGLLEWEREAPAAADLEVAVEASNPALLMARAIGGERPPVRIGGDARFAADVDWLLDNLRWDAGADLERAFGPVVAQQLLVVGRAAAAALRAAIRSAGALGDRLRS